MPKSNLGFGQLKNKHMKNNIFEQETVSTVIERINQLKDGKNAEWGKMSAAQMLAHCNVQYEMVYEDKHAKPNMFMKFMLKLLVKKKVVTDVPYPKNGQTAPQFVIKDDKNFEGEKKRLIDYLQKTQELGEAHFDGKESFSFGPLNLEEWNYMFYKHLDHHLKQFGV